MKKTVGLADRAVRILLAVGAAAGSVVLGVSTGWGIALLAVAAIMAFTAASRLCPLYSLLGIATMGSGKAAGEQRDAPRPRQRALRK